MKREFPFPAYPNGWFVVCYTDELSRGQVEAIAYFGRQLVLFRDEHGDAHVFDAYCPHLGAHLGIGGKVDGRGLRCPFHAWLWDGETGRCTEIPYARRIPPAAKVRSWPVCEQSGFIYLWHHAEQAEPGSQPPPIEEYESGGWGDYTHLRWRVKSRMYDMGENPVDHVHFKTLHGAHGAPSYEKRKKADGTSSNYSEMKMPTPKGDIAGSIESQYHGPGMGVVRVKGVVDTIIVTHSTPIDDETVDVRFSYLQRADLDERMALVGKKMIAELKRQMEQDIVIFEHKKYLTNPLLLPEDGPIARYRREARSQYSGSFWDEDSGPA